MTQLAQCGLVGKVFMTEFVEIGVLDNKVQLLQPKEGFRTSIDSVLLAAACPVKAGQRVLDMGCGVGGSGLCLLYRVPDAFLTGVDVQALCVETAVQNARNNGFSQCSDFILSSILDFDVESPDARFDHVICNPPFMEAGEHMISPVAHKAISNGHLDEGISIQHWVKSALRLLKSKGSLTMIHRADAVDRIIRAMGKSFGQIEVIPLWPKQGVDAKRVIVRAVKDRKTPAIIRAGLVLHKEDGSYTDEAQIVFRAGAGLYSVN